MTQRHIILFLVPFKTKTTPKIYFLNQNLCKYLNNLSL